MAKGGKREGAGRPKGARDKAPRAVWVSVTPFGLEGPRAGWRAGNLGVMAASGNMWLACIQQFFTNIGWVFIVLWLPRYFGLSACVWRQSRC